MQVEIRSPAGGFIARVDYLWERARLVGEADGVMKYEQRDDLYAEKRREDVIRSQGYQVLRWGMADLRSRALAERIRKSLA
jgi:very-short-patch-repair endonuclease